MGREPLKLSGGGLVKVGTRKDCLDACSSGLCVQLCSKKVKQSKQKIGSAPPWSELILSGPRHKKTSVLPRSEILPLKRT